MSDPIVWYFFLCFGLIGVIGLGMMVVVMIIEWLGGFKNDQ